MSTGEQFAEGIGFITLTCPECGRTTAPLVMSIYARLTVDLEGGSLRPVLKAKAVEHDCRATARTAPLFDVSEPA